MELSTCLEKPGFGMPRHIILYIYRATSIIGCGASRYVAIKKYNKKKITHR